VWGAASFWVTSTALTPVVSQVTATGLQDRNGARMELTVRELQNTNWRFAAFGRENLHMDSNARTDSYDSTLGTWESQSSGVGVEQYAGLDGDVGSNANISMDQNSQVWGDAAPGPGDYTDVLGNAEVTGSTMPMTHELEFPPLIVPSYPDSGNLMVTGPETIPSGDYTYGNVTVSANKTLNIVGPARIVIKNFQIKGGAQVVIDATAGPVEFWVIDDFKMYSNSQVHATDYLPKNVKLNLLSDNVINPEVIVELDDIEFESNSEFYGTIYAPNANIVIDSDFELFGAIIARGIELDSNCFIHFDEDLLNSTANSQVMLEVLCWRELPFTP
jgi:hypothetical protein